MNDKTPAEEAIEILSRELPGFEARVDGARDTVSVRGTFRIAAGITNGSLHEVRMHLPEYGVAEIIGRMVGQVRERANWAVGLDAYVTDLVEKARAEGERKGYGDGRIAGYSEGYGAGRRAGVNALMRAVNDE